MHATSSAPLIILKYSLAVPMEFLLLSLALKLKTAVADFSEALGPTEADYSRQTKSLMSSPNEGGISPETAIYIVIIAVFVKFAIGVVCCQVRKHRLSRSPESQFLALTIDKFLTDMEREKPIRFTSHQLRAATDDFTNLLGSGGFGAVYKGMSNRTTVAVKVLQGISNKRVEEQFMAEVSTIGRLHHFNLVRLYGFCFEKDLRALVYEYMGNGSLDRFLFHENKILGFEKLYEIAVGTAKGIAYLHEECQQRIIHYDIKPGNILLDEKFFPKVADFGLAKLCNRENTHITLTGGRGTPGYAAPELWMPYPITHKCDVYSFGMLLFEIVGRRRNLDANLPQSQQWFPKWVWRGFENGDLKELLTGCGVEEQNRETAERLLKAALWCVQYRPESRPPMSSVVKMLEGLIDIPTPLNPFPQLLEGNSCPELLPQVLWTAGTLNTSSSQQ